MSQKIEVTVKGMDCAGCARNVQSVLEKLEGIESAEVLLSAEKARLVTGPKPPDHQTIKKAVEEIGYRVPDSGQGEGDEEQDIENIARKS
jgi:copper chaperone CopZ